MFDSQLVTKDRCNKVNMVVVRLKSSDGEVFCVDVGIARMSTVIRTMLDDLNTQDSDDDELIPLPKVTGTVLRNVIEWCTHHKDDPIKLELIDNHEKICDDILPWDLEFLQVDQSMLYDIILAANYLDIKGLLHVACKSVAMMIKGKSPEDIRKLFNIRNDFSQAEEEQIRKENEWCMKK